MIVLHPAAAQVLKIEPRFPGSRILSHIMFTGNEYLVSFNSGILNTPKNTISII